MFFEHLNSMLGSFLIVTFLLTVRRSTSSYHTQTKESYIQSLRIGREQHIADLSDQVPLPREPVQHSIPRLSGQKVLFFFQPGIDKAS